MFSAASFLHATKGLPDEAIRAEWTYLAMGSYVIIAIDLKDDEQALRILSADDPLRTRKYVGVITNVVPTSKHRPYYTHTFHLLLRDSLYRKPIGIPSCRLAVKPNKTRINSDSLIDNSLSLSPSRFDGHGATDFPLPDAFHLLDCQISICLPLVPSHVEAEYILDPTSRTKLLFEPDVQAPRPVKTSPGCPVKVEPFTLDRLGELKDDISWHASVLQTDYWRLSELGLVVDVPSSTPFTPSRSKDGQNEALISFPKSSPLYHLLNNSIPNFKKLKPTKRKTSYDENTTPRGRRLDSFDTIQLSHTFLPPNKLVKKPKSNSKLSTRRRSASLPAQRDRQRPPFPFFPYTKSGVPEPPLPWNNSSLRSNCNPSLPSFRQVHRRTNSATTSSYGPSFPHDGYPGKGIAFGHDVHHFMAHGARTMSHRREHIYISGSNIRYKDGTFPRLRRTREIENLHDWIS